MNSAFKISLVLAASALTILGCAQKPGEGSGSLAVDSASVLPVLIAPVEGDTTKFYVYTAAPGGETGVNICIDVTLDECVGGTSAKNMRALKDANNRSFYASFPLALNEGSVINLVALNGAATLKSRSLKLTSAGPEMTLDLPHERQVFQRQTADKGPVLVSLHVDAAAGAKFLRVRLSGVAASNGSAANGQWQEFPVAPDAAGVVKQVVEAPAGGWFKLDVLLMDAAKTKSVGHGQVQQIGVGEVFMIAGQSNSTNCGRVPQTVDNDFVVSTDGAKWQKGDDPQLGVHDDAVCNAANGHGGSNWPNTGNALVKKYRVPVAFASTGYSGTAIKDWDAGAPPPTGDAKNLGLFEYSARRAEQLAVAGFRAVLWHQGENDAKDSTTSADYEKGLSDVVNGIRGRTKATTPWLIAVASWCAPGAYGPEWKGASAEVTGAQQKMVAQKSLPELFAGPSTDDLDQTFRGTSAEPQDCHFNDKGLKEAGSRWADKISAFIDGKNGGGQ